MTYTLYIGDRMYSSWSLRGWLMLEKFSLPYDAQLVGLYSGTMAQDLADLAPARLVPTLKLPDGTVVGETMAMAETLAERHPDAGLWPQDATSRATARWLCAEMAAGFSALRSACPMQLSHIWQGFQPSEAVLTDLRRIEALFAHARKISGHATGPLFGAYSLAEVFYTPVAARIVGYDLPVSDATRAYCIDLLRDPAVLSWQEAAREVRYDPEPYLLDLDRKPWAL
ncbi:glutathione S-transferase [Tritonibacter mobilis]|uniref:Glutathione S-transferase n=1 Tax=Tritonibacter mobilis F1926 TaxID=1265309 RepID=A0A1B0ZYX2_9RHOB|nr:glutathione S-transferase [Tritonibacter mobilis]ANP39534.1 glutathione S-transferase [Tritonibacter mobilis F1926]KJZ23629.1 glutathione S-transferase [Tritonibacter mobilis]